MRFFSFFLLLFCTSVFSSLSTSLENSKVLAFASEKLPHEGVLKQAKDGFLYVELSKNYVFDLIPLLSEKNVCPPPYFTADKIGAHITIATAEEMKSIKLSSIPCLGEKISFSPVSLEKETLVNSEIGPVVYFLTVDSPQFSEIRKALKLSPKIKDFDFHITIGVNCP